MTQNIKKHLDILNHIQNLDQQESSKNNQIKLLTLHVVKDCPREIKQNIYTRTLKTKIEQQAEKVLLDLEKIKYLFQQEKQELINQHEAITRQKQKEEIARQISKKYEY